MEKDEKQIKVLMIDNFDSFTFNLVHYLEKLGVKVEVKRNNEIAIEEIKKLNPSHIVLSPGPGSPDDSGVCIDIVKQLKGVFPILGVCLGHQVIGSELGAKVEKASIVMHGKASIIHHTEKGLFKNLSQGFKATRYHSLLLKNIKFNKDLIKTAWCFDEGKEVVMAIEVKGLSLFGVQFHPESVASEYGELLLLNFLKIRI